MRLNLGEPTCSRGAVIEVESCIARARGLGACDFRVGVMRGAKWLVQHKMATLAWNLHKKDERAIVVASRVAAGLSLRYLA